MRTTVARYIKGISIHFKAPLIKLYTGLNVALGFLIPINLVIIKRNKTNEAQII